MYRIHRYKQNIVQGYWGQIQRTTILINQNNNSSCTCHCFDALMRNTNNKNLEGVGGDWNNPNLYWIWEWWQYSSGYNRMTKKLPIKYTFLWGSLLNLFVFHLLTLSISSHIYYYFFVCAFPRLELYRRKKKHELGGEWEQNAEWFSRNRCLCAVDS